MKIYAKLLVNYFVRLFEIKNQLRLLPETCQKPKRRTDVFRRDEKQRSLATTAVSGMNTGREKRSETAKFHEAPQKLVVCIAEARFVSRPFRLHSGKRRSKCCGGRRKTQPQLADLLTIRARMQICVPS